MRRDAAQYQAIPFSSARSKPGDDLSESLVARSSPIYFGREGSCDRADTAEDTGEGVQKLLAIIQCGQVLDPHHQIDLAGRDGLARKDEEIVQENLIHGFESAWIDIPKLLDRSQFSHIDLGVGLILGVRPQPGIENARRMTQQQSRGEPSSKSDCMAKPSRANVAGSLVRAMMCGG
jgi:hypothetical protein